MATPVMMPNVGITVETCVLTKWLKQKGETVEEGEVLFTYETDKSTLEQEAPVSGTVLEIFFGEDSDVPVMTNVCVIGAPGEDVEEFRPGTSAKEEGWPSGSPSSRQSMVTTMARVAVPLGSNLSSATPSIRPFSRQYAVAS